MSLQEQGTRDLLPLRARLFAPGQRLGWVFRDRHQFAEPFHEPPPARQPVHPRLHAERDAAQRRFRTTLIVAVAVAAGFFFLFVLVTALGHLLPGSGAGLAGVVLLALAVPGLVLAGVMAAHRNGAARAVQQAEHYLMADHQMQTAAWAQRKAAHERADWARVNALDEWGAARTPTGTRRIDVFGGSLHGWEAFLTVYGTSTLGERPVLVADFSREVVCRELALLTRAAGAPVDLQLLPTQLAESSVLAGLSGPRLAAALVESMHPSDDSRAARVQRSIDGRVLTEVCDALGDDVSFPRLAAALRVLMGEHDGSGLLSVAERRRIASELFTADYRRELQPDLIRIESHIHPLTGLGSSAAPRDAAYLTCIALQPDAPNVRDELLAELIIQWLIHHVSNASAPDPAVIIVGADDLARRHLERLSDACERHGVPLTLIFRHLRETSTNLLGGGAVGFMRLGNHDEAARAADFIGRQHRFVLTQLTASIGGDETHTTEVSESEGASDGINPGSAAGWLMGLAAGGPAGLAGLVGLRRAGRAMRTTSRTWSTAHSHAVGGNWSDAASAQRVYEYAVEPTTLQHLPDYAMLLVTAGPGGQPWLAAVECNPEIVTLPRVSTDPLPDVLRLGLPPSAPTEKAGWQTGAQRYAAGGAYRPGGEIQVPGSTPPLQVPMLGQRQPPW